VSDAAVVIVAGPSWPQQRQSALARSLGEGVAADLQEAFLQDALSQLHDPGRWQLYLARDESADDPALAQLDLFSSGAIPLPISPASVAGPPPLLRLLRNVLARHQRVVVLGAQLPQIGVATVAAALAALDGADLVLSPGQDGGYSLIGLCRPHDLFTPLQASASISERATVALAAELGLKVAHVERLTEMHEAQDLLILPAEAGPRAQRTRQLLSGLSRTEVAVELPRELQIEASSRCNLRCSACLRTHRQLDPDADLSFADYRRIVDDLPALQRVSFQLNGEPLLCADLFAMVSHAVEAGAHTIINSNATLLGSDRRRALLDSGLHELRVSLDGARPATIEQAAGADVRDRVVDNVRGLAAERKSAAAPRISFWMIARQDTIAELPELVQLAAEVGIDEVYLQRLVLTGEGSATEQQSLHGRLSAAQKDTIALAEQRAAELGVALRASGRKPIVESLTPSGEPNPWLGCWRPWRSATVTAELRVLPCCISSFTAHYDELARGSLRELSWQQIWNGPGYRALRRGLLQAEPLRFCRGCNCCWSL